MSVVFVFQRIHILVPVSLVLCNLVFEACNDCSVEALHLAVGLGAIIVCRQVLNFQAHGHGGKELIRIAVRNWSVST